MKYYIGKTDADTLGHKFKNPKYINESLSIDKVMCEKIAARLSGFAGYEVVQVEIVEVKRKKK